MVNPCYYLYNGVTVAENKEEDLKEMVEYNVRQHKKEIKELIEYKRISRDGIRIG